MWQIQGLYANIASYTYQRSHGRGPPRAQVPTNSASAMTAATAVHRKTNRSACTPSGGAPGSASRSTGQRKHDCAERADKRSIQPPHAGEGQDADRQRRAGEHDHRAVSSERKQPKGPAAMNLKAKPNLTRIAARLLARL